MATFDEFFASLDLDEDGNIKKDKSEKGIPFEQIFVKWFLLNDPIWSSIVDQFLETDKKENKLNPEKIRQLEDLGFL